MVWSCFAASEPGQLAIIDGKVNSQVYQDILQENVSLSVRQVDVMQQDNDPKQGSKSTTEWLQQKKVHLLEWHSQSPTRFKMLWHNLEWFTPDILRILLN